MTSGGLEIPAQTITLSSDQLASEARRRMDEALAGFRVYRSAFYLRLQHLPCLEILRTTPEAMLTELVDAALQHACTVSPQ